jgi:hypothetical protein
MALDAGSEIYVVPDPTTAGTTGAVTNQVTFVGAAVKGGFLVCENCDLVEAGAIYTTAGTTTAMVFKVIRSADTSTGARADVLGVTGSASATAPSATQPVGLILSKKYNVRLNKGDFVEFQVTTAPTAAGGYFYAKVYPAGAPALASDESTSTT